MGFPICLHIIVYWLNLLQQESIHILYVCVLKIYISPNQKNNLQNSVAISYKPQSTDFWLRSRPEWASRHPLLHMLSPYHFLAPVLASSPQAGSARILVWFMWDGTLSESPKVRLVRVANCN